MYCNGVQWPSYHRRHYLKGLLPPIGHHYEVRLIYNIFTNYIKIHRLRYLICCEKYYTIITFAKHCHRESLITPPCGCIFLLFPSQSI